MLDVEHYLLVADCLRSFIASKESSDVIDNVVSGKQKVCLVKKLINKN